METKYPELLVKVSEFTKAGKLYSYDGFYWFAELKNAKYAYDQMRNKQNSSQSGSSGT